MHDAVNIIAPENFKRYISLVDAQDVRSALLTNGGNFISCLNDIAVEKRDYAYAPGKWTMKQVLQHVIDAERIFAYRALWIARKAPEPLPGFDENTWADIATAQDRDWDAMVEEFNLVRKTTEILFGSFSQSALGTTGISNNKQVNVLALGYMCAGHAKHHINVIRERYL
jgi:hypothetical protein